MQWIRLTMVCCGMDGNVRSECEEDEGTNCEAGD